MGINPNRNEKAVLGVLAEHFRSHGELLAFLSFNSIMGYARLDRRTVRKACRRLKRYGLTMYEKGLCDDVGDFRGAGYAITQAGLDYCDSIKKERP